MAILEIIAVQPYLPVAQYIEPGHIYVVKHKIWDTVYIVSIAKQIRGLTFVQG